ncbi:hypothetical protein ACVNPX_09295 [Staphylococcus aureus]
MIQQGTGVQVIYGPHVTVIKNEIEEFAGDQLTEISTQLMATMYEVSNMVPYF